MSFCTKTLPSFLNDYWRLKEYLHYLAMGSACSQSCVFAKKTHPQMNNDGKLNEIASFPLSTFQKCLIRYSWREVEKHSVRIGVTIFVRFFQEHPQAMQLFKEFRNTTIEELKAVETLPNHIEAVLGALKRAVEALDDAESFLGVIESIGQSHGSIAVDESYFEALGNSILIALGENLGTEWTDDVNEA